MWVDHIQSLMLSSLICKTLHYLPHKGIGREKNIYTVKHFKKSKCLVDVHYSSCRCRTWCRPYRMCGRRQNLEYCRVILEGILTKKTMAEAREIHRIGQTNWELGIRQATLWVQDGNGQTYFKVFSRMESFILLFHKMYWSNKRINTVWFRLYGVPRSGKFIETESRLEVSRAGGGRTESYCLMGINFLFGVMKMLWKG